MGPRILSLVMATATRRSKRARATTYSITESVPAALPSQRRPMQLALERATLVEKYCSSLLPSPPTLVSMFFTSA